MAKKKSSDAEENKAVVCEIDQTVKQVKIIMPMKFIEKVITNPRSNVPNNSEVVGIELDDNNNIIAYVHNNGFKDVDATDIPVYNFNPGRCH